MSHRELRTVSLSCHHLAADQGPVGRVGVGEIAAVRQRLGWMVESLARGAGADVRLDGLATGLGGAAVVLLGPS